MGKIIRNGIEYSGSYDNAISINYDNTNSGLNATTVQEGIDEIKEDLKPHANVNPIVNLLTTETGYALDATQGKVLDDKIALINNSLNNYLIKHIHIFPYEIKANANTNFNITENIAKNGYTPIGIVGYAVNAWGVIVLNLRLLGTEWDCYLKNLSIEDISANLHVEILYIKNT